MEAVIDKIIKNIEKTIAEVDNSYCAHCLNHDLGIDIEYLKENRPAHFFWGVRDCRTQTVFDRLDISTFLYWTRENHQCARPSLAFLAGWKSLSGKA